jgi:acyl homoserine lactone synthase
MHRLRKRVFRDRLQWNVEVRGDLEADDFDGPDAVYLLALDDGRQVIGSWRLLATTGPTMVRSLWPAFLESLPMPERDDVWEASRFAVDNAEGCSAENMAQVSRATQELFCGLTELCILCGIREVYTMYDMRIARLLRRLDCPPRAVSATLKVDGHLTQAGIFATDAGMLARLRAVTGLQKPLVNPDALPPLLQGRRERDRSGKQDNVHENVPA